MHAEIKMTPFPNFHKVKKKKKRKNTTTTHCLKCSLDFVPDYRTLDVIALGFCHEM